VDVPYIIALVDLEGVPDVRLLTNVVDCALDDVRVGMPVKVIFEDASQEMSLFKFAPAD
jgi:uncharacterized OB-fold protein